MTQTQKSTITQDEQLIRVLENLPEGVALHDETHIFYVNQATETLLGISRQEIKKKKLVEFLHPDDVETVMRRIKKIILNGTAGISVPIQERLLRPDGNTVYVEISGNVINHEGRPAGLIQLRDITKEKLLLETERAKKEAAERSLQLRDEFISIASHELKTPLTSLRLQIQTINKLLTDTAAETPVVAKLLLGADSQIARLGKLVDQLLDINKISHGKLHLNKRPCDLSLLLQEIIARFISEAETYDCKVLFHGPDTLIGNWDMNKIDQIFVNILNNALKFGAGKPVTATLGVEQSEHGEIARISISDSGCGIGPSDQERIFERFEKVPSTREAPGMGLGLYIAREIARRHGGNIRVSSALDQGAEFIVELPLN